MRVFHKKSGGIVQLIDKKKMEAWPVELPFIFIEYVRDKLLDTYEDTSVRKEVESYLDEVIEEVAVPRLLSIIKGEDQQETILALERLKDLSKKDVEMTKPIKPYLDDLLKSKNKEVKSLAEDISKSFEREERKKMLAKKRKEMQKKEQQFMDGKISAEEYAKARKEYLELRG